MSDSRSRFEEWAAEKCPWVKLHKSGMPPPTRYYVSFEAENMCAAYQAAEAQAVQECVEILEGARNARGEIDTVILRRIEAIRAAFPHAFKE